MADFIGRLCEMSEGWAGAKSLWETRYWEAVIVEQVVQCLKRGEERNLVAALETLHGSESAAYELLAQLVEDLTASGGNILGRGSRSAGLLMAVPVLIDSRFEVGSPMVPAVALDGVRAALERFVVASDVRLSLVDRMLSPEQLPGTYAGVMQTAVLSIEAAAQGLPPKLKLDLQAESPFYLADVRYLLVGAYAEAGAPLYRWQQKGGADQARERLERQWQQQVSSLLAETLPACCLRVLLPAPYYHAQRLADEALRPFALKASLNLLHSNYELGAEKIQAVIAPFYDWGLVEFRISFLALEREEVLQGCIWPVLDSDEVSAERIESAVRTALQAAGVGVIETLDRRIPVVYCDDCGAPLFPDRRGELQHVEEPSDMLPISSELH